eukprot:366410-Chlamydomonas_euryale.AAC.12
MADAVGALGMPPPLPPHPVAGVVVQADVDEEERMSPLTAVLLLYGTLVGSVVVPRIGVASQRPDLDATYACGCRAFLCGCTGRHLCMHVCSPQHAHTDPAAQFIMLAAQTALFYWKKRDKKSYDLVSLHGLLVCGCMLALVCDCMHAMCTYGVRCMHGLTTKMFSWAGHADRTVGGTSNCEHATEVLAIFNGRNDATEPQSPSGMKLAWKAGCL